MFKKYFFSPLPNSHLAKLVFATCDLACVGLKITDGFAFTDPAFNCADGNNCQSNENFHSFFLYFFDIDGT